MSQQLRQLKYRIRSVEGTWKITRAMEMVAMAKYKSVEAPLQRTRTFFSKLESVTHNLVRTNTFDRHVFLPRKLPPQVPIMLFIISSEAGLCGNYNTRLFKAVEKFLVEQAGREVRIFVYGRRALSFFRRRGGGLPQLFPAMHGRVKKDFHTGVVDTLLREFTAAPCAGMYVAYTRFENAMRHEPRVDKILPVEPSDQAQTTPFLVESGNQGILNDILPMYVANRLRLMMLESFTSEFSARMVAMKTAKDNAKELMGDLILQRNRIRQAVITKEVIEIISSAEALKG